MKEYQKKIITENKATKSKGVELFKKIASWGFILLVILLVFKWFNKPTPTPLPPSECAALESIQNPEEVEKSVVGCWKHYIATYDTATSLHFRCRLACRDISMRDVYTALEKGELRKIDVFGCKNANQNQGLVEPCLEVWGENGRGQLLCVILAIKIKQHKLMFVTAYQKKGGVKCDSDCDFKR